ncbi:glutamine cyclotransferase [Sinobacterium caligoides]|uniref:Glutamine cyclotransferase n=1 Tax=Sinobacterium caligoides TaxID=933926 RepID=A0A3N2DY92_9GAMM|nr:glutaminyl-peptide cyclotransferase [Sinobacterium caligoides]ROS04820.1 glutamine cyclotransferase [Sinobacterium caligoides]
MPPPHTIKPLLLLMLTTLLPARAGAAPEWQQTVSGEKTTLTALARVNKDPKLFTQGLVIDSGWLYESSGGYGRSKVCKTPLPLASLDKRQSYCQNLNASLFAEGITLYRQHLFRLSWRSGELAVYNSRNLSIIKTIPYRGQGWGLTHNNQHFIMSDGSYRLYFRNLDSFALEGHVDVTWQGRKIKNLNELQWIEGQIWANQWHSNLIYIIEPKSGVVLETLDFSHLAPQLQHRDPDAVLNGIAYDNASRQLVITGKRWPYYFRFQLNRRASQ